MSLKSEDLRQAALEKLDALDDAHSAFQATADLEMAIKRGGEVEKADFAASEMINQLVNLVLAGDGDAEAILRELTPRLDTAISTMAESKCRMANLLEGRAAFRSGIASGRPN